MKKRAWVLFVVVCLGLTGVTFGVRRCYRMKNVRTTICNQKFDECHGYCNPKGGPPPNCSGEKVDPAYKPVWQAEYTGRPPADGGSGYGWDVVLTRLEECQLTTNCLDIQRLNQACQLEVDGNHYCRSQTGSTCRECSEGVWQSIVYTPSDYGVSRGACPPHSSSPWGAH